MASRQCLKWPLLNRMLPRAATHPHIPRIEPPTLRPPPPPRIPTCLHQPSPPASALSRRLFSHSPARSRQVDPRKPPEYDYDPNLGDPWYHHRLRTAKPLFRGNAKTILRSPRTHTVVVVSIALAVAFYFYNLEVVPVSGRKRFNCYSEKTVRQASDMQYKRLLYEMERSGARFLGDWDPRTLMVRRVMSRLIPVSGVDDDEAQWEVHVIDDRSTANAFVLPGGKVFVYSGILGLARTESQLAAVLGHEIAHNLAKHFGERLSQSIGESFFLGSALMLLAATPLMFVAGWLFGGDLLGLLFSRPMGRMQESEADYIGLMMMAEACYDPREAVTFWQRMDRMHQQSDMEIPEWASTHPSNQHRIERITGWLPKAMEKREASDCHGTQGFAEMFRRAMARGDVMSGGM